LENKYEEFKKLVQETGSLAKLSQEVYNSPNPSMAAKNIAANLYSKRNRFYSTYLLNSPSNEEIYSVLVEGGKQKSKKVETKIQKNLEEIIRDAPKDLVKFAVENISPIKSNKYNKIFKAHKKYRKLSKDLQDYKILETRKEARGKLLREVDRVYDERYFDCDRTKRLMKKMARFSDIFLVGEYKEIIRQAKEKFEKTLQNNEVNYLNANVKDLDDKTDFISYLVSGDKKYLVKSAQENDDESGAELLEEEIQRDEIANMSPEQAREIILRNYEQANEYSEGDFVISRGEGIATNPAGNILIENAA